MNRSLSLFLLLGLASVLPSVAAAEGSPIKGKVVKVAITSAELTETRRWRETRKQLDLAIQAGVSAIVFDVQVSAGRTPAALAVAEEIARLKVRTLAFIGTSAVGGGALIALGCDEIWMAPGSRIGAAPPTVPDESASEKAQEIQLAESMALLKAGVRSLCKLKGHDASLAMAFIDKDVEFKIADRVLSARGELLLLDADDAVLPHSGKPLFAKGLAADVDALLKSAGLSGPTVPLTSELFASKEPVVQSKGEPSKPSAVTEKGQPVRMGPYTGKVVVIPVGEEDLIARARFEFMSRTLKRCSEEGAEAVIFDLDTPGGLAWDTTNLMMKDLQKLRPRSFAYVNPRALSAGAMIAVATDEIYMAPASSAGAATPVYGNGAEMGEAERAKMNSAIMSMARTVAKEKGRDPRVIEAMIDMDRELVVNGEVLCAKGEILTLDAEQAILQENGRSIFAKAIVKNLDEIKAAEALKGDTVTAVPTGFEQIAILVTKYAAILILIGVAAGYVEMQAPGFGLPGLVSITAFGLFFFGHYVAGSLVGQETAVAAAIFGIGVLLLLLEFFVFPGSLVPGITGFVCVMVALVYTMSGWEAAPSVPFPDPTSTDAPAATGFSLSTYALGLRNFAIGIIGAAGLILVLARYLPESRPFQKMVLSSSAGGSIESTPAAQVAARIEVGDHGVTRSALRPYGTIEINQLSLEAMAEGGYIDSGTPVRVREKQGVKIIVEAVS